MVMTLTLFPLSGLQVCWVAGLLRAVLSFPSELHFSSVHSSSPAVVVDSHHFPPSLIPPERMQFPTKTFPSVLISETLYTAYKVTFMLCSMLKWSDLQCVWTALAKGPFRTQRKLEERSEGEQTAAPGKGNKRCLNERLMDCCITTWHHFPWASMFLMNSRSLSCIC